MMKYIKRIAGLCFYTLYIMVVLPILTLIYIIIDEDDE